jgi:hypothetical protein
LRSRVSRASALRGETERGGELRDAGPRVSRDATQYSSENNFKKCCRASVQRTTTTRKKKKKRCHQQ